MSEDLVLPPSDEGADIIKTVEEVKSENAVTPKTVSETADDLEDGEIDDDDDDDNDEPIVDVKPAPPVGLAATVQSSPVHGVMPPMDAMNDQLKKAKLRKHNAMEDDFAGSVESAIAAALKKDGIMPPMPKILEAREDTDKQGGEKEVILSKSGRRRKRRKLRDEREREKEKKKHRTPSSPDAGPLAGLGQRIDDEYDDDEMLCIRGGSPQPLGLTQSLPSAEANLTSKKETYDSDDSYSSYDSYDSAHNFLRYSSTRKKEVNAGPSGSRSKRKERNRRDDERRPEKRSRRNYDDSGGEEKYIDRHPQQPRKLELCKFYLMECCAKKDKCSYMHSDFPCKYYYLGMECVYRSACKFSHGKPLTDQLRSVLLKHLETAPKEILGTFRRISRENALNLLNVTHERLCEEHGMENIIGQPAITTKSVIQPQAGGIRNGELPSLHQLQQQQLQQQQQQMQSEVIPSLLDMVINIPPSTSTTSMASTAIAVTVTTAGGANSNNKSEKQRKSRWCDTAVTNSLGQKQLNLEPPSSTAPSYLDLKNLTGILSTDRIEKLLQFGVVNLEQINQLTLSQLNNIGLTIAEISEIQLNARNMARLGVVCVQSEAATPNHLNSTSTTAAPGSLPSSQDVDMRFLPSCLPLTTTTVTTSTATSENLKNDIALSSPDPQPLLPAGLTTAVAANMQDTRCIGGIDYSQYLRDSNLGYDKNDLLDDEKDEEQLVIDDQASEMLDDNSQTNDTETRDGSEIDSKPQISYAYGGGDSNDARLPPKIKLSAKHQQLLKDPTNLYTVNVSALIKNEEAKLKADSIQPRSYSDDSFYGAITNPVRRDTDTREGYHDTKPEPEEEYRITDIREDFRLAETLLRDDYRDPRLPSRSTDQARSNFPYKVNQNDDDSDRSRSQSPALSIAQQMENFVSLYERPSMYDWTPKCIQEDLEYNKRNIKADKDMRLARFLDSSNSDIDLRLPFQPLKNIQIAKEIDASLSPLMAISYKITEIDVPEPKYSDLRQSFQCDDSTDPRLRRILGLPELSNSKVLSSLGRNSRPTIASPSSVESSSSPTHEKEKGPPSPTPSVSRGPRIDPRRAAAAATATVTSIGATQNSPTSGSNPQQNVQIRMLLQKSDWYKNLNSKYKIMVNQQLALVSTELKRFHQDPSPNKVFDIQFILSNQSLQQILTNLGIYIDDNGQVTQLENENDNEVVAGGGPGLDYGGGGANSNQMMMLNEQNMSMQQRMVIQQQMEFLRNPPPNLNIMGLGGGNGTMGPGGPGLGPQQGMFGNGMMPQFGGNLRLGLLGMPPGVGGGGGFNPFGGNSSDNGGNMMEPNNYCGPNNPFANNFGVNGGHFSGQQMNRGNRNNFNRQGGCMNNGGNRMNQNRRPFNNGRERRGGGNNNCGGGGAPGGLNNANNGNHNGNGDPEESWDNDMN